MSMLLIVLGFSTQAMADGVKEFKMSFGQKLSNQKVDGNVTVNTSINTSNQVVVGKDYYAADTHGFSKLPSPSLVTPLSLGYVKFGGNLHSVYNWELNAYFDLYENSFSYVSSPLERRMQLVQNYYHAKPMFQVNMMGFQPEVDQDGNFSLQESATAETAGQAIAYLNGEKKLGVNNILMGNEPFHWESTHGKALPSADEYIEKFIEYVMELKKAQEKSGGDPSALKIWGPELATGWVGWQTTHPDDCQVDYTLPEKMKCSYGDGKFSEFMPYFLSRIAEFESDEKMNPFGYKLLDFVTFHYYPLFRTSFADEGSIITDANGNEDVPGMLESVNLWDNDSYINKYDAASPKGVQPKIIKKFQNWMKMFYPQAELAVTEYGIDSADKIAYHPIVRPLYLADLMARVAATGVATFTKSFLQSGSDAGNPWSLIDGTNKTHLYNVYSLYSNNFLGSVLESKDSFGDQVNVYSVKNSTETNIFLVNKDAVAHTTGVKLNTTLSVGEIALPAWSMTVLKVPNANRGDIKVLQYGAKEMGITIPAAYIK
ncbi:MAG: hypothetical protein COW00_15070 [Bdellovibrio sp. CG12_big_fil_rev_8_21_14_0_65_39_13]|nr:MAG: hypothetical protein COW78_00625 [Bdellovibrio sp. CG22_combo_CG10-13_8_21_14_all_39_27]PIQ58613.1 MAG: hypothetical protein COW00_15070 [Bdellovibrio sp. CG12_big_fil_rev_8_21_14_0_65_39_13]PIR33821.1 MAG: hypothetical protein COV37_15030 [Bdellovibrio sp. CG11_big_fil_rev_8_21_14_0_20_39_38]